MKKSVCINSSNLHVGGGVQVATSFIYELSKMDSKSLNFHVICSSEVDRNLSKIEVNKEKFASYTVCDTRGIKGMSRKAHRFFQGYDAIFTVFGPDYRVSGQDKTLVGFAQPWIIFPNNEVFQSLSLVSWLKVKSKLIIQKFFYRKASRLVVELPHVKEAVVRQGIATRDSVEVVHNSISRIYFQPQRWENVDLTLSDSSFKLGFVGRDYSHKNLKILPEVKAILQREHGLDVQFFVTLNKEEYATKSAGFRNAVSSVGELSVAQCPTFYRKMDGVIFPSLLECFSATPLEAMAMERPLFASDRGFVRDVCQDWANYFDPLSPESAAAVIAGYFLNERGKDKERLSSARKYAQSFSSAQGRAKAYVRILEDMVA